jgi:hypothetical protein
VSSYGRNTFTRGTSCLCLARSPLYTSAAATCPGSPRLRRRSAIPPWTYRATPSVSPVSLLVPDATFPAGAASCWLSLEPSSPEYNHPGLRHRRQAQPCGTIPAQQSSRNMSSVSVSVNTRTVKVSPRDRSRTRTESRQHGRTWARLPKVNFSNSSPSSVRAVLNPRWAELTMNLCRGEEWASELPRTAHADAESWKKTCIAP